MQSSFLSLNTKDFIKGLVVAVLTSVITIIYTSLQAGSLEFNWKLIASTGLSSALAYILKNLVTNSDDEMMKKEK